MARAIQTTPLEIVAALGPVGGDHEITPKEVWLRVYLQELAVHQITEFYHQSNWNTETATGRAVAAAERALRSFKEQFGD